MRSSCRESISGVRRPSAGRLPAGRGGPQQPIGQGGSSTVLSATSSTRAAAARRRRADNGTAAATSHDNANVPTPLLRSRDESPPGPSPLPVLGNLMDVGLGKVARLGPQPHVRMKELADVYGDVMSVTMGGGAPWVVISSPERVWEAFVKRGRDFSGRPMVPSMSVSSGGGQGFASSKMTPELRTLRRTAFSQLFSRPSVERGHRLFLQEAEALADHLSTANATPFGYHNELRPAVRQAASNMVLSYGLSLRAPYSTESSRRSTTSSREAEELLKVVSQLWECLTDTSTTFLDLVVPAGSAVDLPRGAYGNLQALVDRRNDLLMQIIVSRRREHQRLSPSSASPTQEDLLGSMIALGMDDQCILYVLVDLFVAGVNTVSSTTEWALLLTAQDRSAQEAMRKDASNSLSYASLCCPGAAPWVDACVQETLRHKQPLLLPRQAVCDSELGGYPISEGTIIYANNYALTHDQRLWKAPQEFRPQRFFEEESRLLAGGAQGEGEAASKGLDDTYKLIPFSVGQRACPGELLAQAELRALLSVLARRLSWEPLQPWGGVDLREDYSLTLQPLESQTLRFKRLS